MTVKAGSTARRAATLLAAAMLLATAACGGQAIDAGGTIEGNSPESASDQNRTDNNDKNQNGKSGSQAPGRAYAVSAKGTDRVRLRYQPEKGSKTHVDLGADIGLTTTVNGKEQPALDMPRFEVHVDYLITDVSGDGSFTQEISLSEWKLAPEDEDPDLEPGARKAIKQAFDSIGTMKGSTTLSPRGEILDTSLELPESAPQQVRSMLGEFKGQLGNLQAPLPNEPVGVGSTWQSKNTLTLTEASFGKLEWVTEYRYQLKEIKGDLVTIEVKYDQKAVPATLNDPNRPKTTGKVTGGTVTGSGTIVVDLGIGATTEGSMEADGTMDMTLESGGKSGDVHYDLSYAFDLGSH